MLIKTTQSNFSKLRILFIQQELPHWEWAHHWSYCWHLGVEEGLKATGVKFFTITTPWLPWIKEICGKRRFDQVWINDLVPRQGEKMWEDKIYEFAPIRLGFICESLEYTKEELAMFPIHGTFLPEVYKRLQYVTHVVTLEEKKCY